jgi:hypothetical protein
MRYRALDTVIDELKGRGFVERFRVTGSKLRAIGRGHTFGSEDLTIREYQRFEGVSDPDNASIIYAVETRDGTEGLLVDAFGLYANPEVGELLEGVRIGKRAPVWRAVAAS